MAARRARGAAYAALAALYVLHNDLWFWDDPGRVLGLPVGLTYHVLFSAAVVVVMWRLVQVAWPGDVLEKLAGGARGDAGEARGDALEDGVDGSVAVSPEDGR